MSNNLQNQIRSTIRRALYTTLGIPMLALPVALAQQATNQTASAASEQPAKTEKTVVTGSLIPTAETVGPAPVDVVGAEQIQQLGTQDPLNTLRKFSPGFLGSGNVGHTLDNGGFGEAYVALRNLPTLVLLDGRRLAGSAFSAIFNAGSQVDLNLIPVSMIERIDVLKDGSSSLYGSDAIGGVVNVITKKNWNGAEISGRYGFAQEGSLTEHRASAIFGVSNEKTSFVGGAQYYRSDPLLAKERTVASQGIIPLYAQNVAPPSYVSPSYPGRVGNFILASSPLAVGAPGSTYGQPGAILSPPVTPGVTYNSIEAYVAANPGVYIPLNTLPGAAEIEAATGSPASRLNTTDFGTFSIQAQDRRNVLGNVEHKVFDERMELFGSFFYANTTSEGNLAPSPMTGLTGQNIFVPANNPYNPFQIGLGAGGDGSINVRSRFVDSGNRRFVAQTDYYRFVGGLKGEFENGYSYESSYYYNRSQQVQFTRNSVNGAGLNQALTPLLQGGVPVLDPQGRPLSVLTDANGVNVPVYNIFSLGGNAPETLQVLKTTLYNSGISDQWAVDGVVRGTPLDLPGGKLGFAVGGTYYFESLFLETDGLTSLGLVPGLNPASPFPGGERTQYAGFIEVHVPITSPEMEVPVLHSLEVNASGRIQHLEPGGDASVPKVSVRLQPLDDQVTLRGTYSEGFLAPTLYTLYGPTRISNPTLSVQGVAAQQTVYLPSNPNLPPSTSHSWSGGIVYSPKQLPGITVSADYYFVNQENIPFNPDGNSRVTDLNANGSASAFAPDFRFADGTQLTTPVANQINVNNFGSLVIPTLPGASQRTDGIDLSLMYSHPFENTMKISGWVSANVLLNYEVQLGPGEPWYQYGGFFTDPQVAAAYQGTLPDYNLTMGIAWEYQGFTLAANARYIPEVTDAGDTFPTAGASASNGYTIDGSVWKVPSWYSVDLQLAYEFGKHKEAKDWYDGTRLAFGVNNVTDNIAPLIASSSEDGTDKGTYDIVGRFFYFEVAKKF